MLDPGMIGAIVGSSIGVAGGIFGTWMSLRNTTPGPQRNLMIKAVIATWAGVLLFVGVIMVLPTTYTWIAWTIYGPLLLCFILLFNRSLARIRAAAGQGVSD